MYNYFSIVAIFVISVASSILSQAATLEVMIPLRCHRVFTHSQPTWIDELNVSIQSSNFKPPSQNLSSKVSGFFKQMKAKRLVNFFNYVAKPQHLENFESQYQLNQTNVMARSQNEILKRLEVIRTHSAKIETYKLTLEKLKNLKTNIENNGDWIAQNLTYGFSAEQLDLFKNNFLEFQNHLDLTISKMPEVFLKEKTEFRFADFRQLMQVYKRLQSIDEKVRFFQDLIQFQSSQQTDFSQMILTKSERTLDWQRSLVDAESSLSRWFSILSVLINSNEIKDYRSTYRRSINGIINHKENVQKAFNELVEFYKLQLNKNYGALNLEVKPDFTVEFLSTENPNNTLAFVISRLKKDFPNSKFIFDPSRNQDDENYGALVVEGNNWYIDPLAHDLLPELIKSLWTQKEIIRKELGSNDHILDLAFNAYSNKYYQFTSAPITHFNLLELFIKAEMSRLAISDEAFTGSSKKSHSYDESLKDDHVSDYFALPEEAPYELETSTTHFKEHEIIIGELDQFITSLLQSKDEFGSNLVIHNIKPHFITNLELKKDQLPLTSLVPKISVNDLSPLLDKIEKSPSADAEKNVTVRAGFHLVYNDKQKPEDWKILEISLTLPPHLSSADYITDYEVLEIITAKLNHYIELRSHVFSGQTTTNGNR